MMDRKGVSRVGRRLAKLRHKAGLTQEALGELSGVDAKTIQSLELGRNAPMLGSVMRIAKALQVPIDAFTRTAPNPAKLRQLIVDALDKLDVGALEALLPIVEEFAARPRATKERIRPRTKS